MLLINTFTTLVQLDLLCLTLYTALNTILLNNVVQGTTVQYTVQYIH